MGNNEYDRIKDRFLLLKKEKRKGLIPFITASDPNIDIFEEILIGLPGSGADFIEIGIPFSDPMADGPSIQLSSRRVLQKKFRLKELFKSVSKLRKTDNITPVILMGYYNPIFTFGIKEFVSRAVRAGVDALIVVDLPPEEADELYQHAINENLHLIFLIAPTTNEQRFSVILEKASGFLYYVSIKGITGTSSANMTEVKEKINFIRTKTSLPVAVGFGIKNAKQAYEFAKYSDVVVVGSAIVDIISKSIKDGEKDFTSLPSKVFSFVHTLSKEVLRSGS